MKKKYIQLSVAVVVLAGMIAALMFLWNNPEETEPDTPPVDAVYVGSGNVPFDRIEITNSSGSYELVKNPENPEGGFIVKGWEKLSLDTYNLGLVSDCVKEMIVKEVIAENAAEADLAAFGLDNPRARVVTHYENGDRGIILLGDNAPGSEGVYIMIEGDSTIFLIMPSLAEPFLKPAVAYVNLTVTPTDTDFKGFDKITLSGADYPEPIMIERTPETTVEYGGMSFGTHGIVSPVKAGLDYQRGMEPLTSLYGLIAYNVAAVVEDGESLKPYGLDKPRASISVTGPAETPGMTFTLRVSKSDENGNVRVMKTGSPVIYELTESSLPWLGLTVFDFMDRTVNMPNIDTVSSIKVTAPGKTYAFTLTGESEDLKISVNGTELGEVTKEDGRKVTGLQNFRQFYQMLISASYEEETDETPPEGAEPIASVEYSYRSGGSRDVLRFYAGPPRRAFISLNGGKYYLITSSYVDRLIEDADQLVPR